MAAGVTYTPISTQTLSSNQTSVNLSSFSGYTDLILVVNGVCSSGSYFTLRFNSDGGSNYSNNEMYWDTPNPGGARNNSATYMYQGSFTTTQNTVINHIQNYSNTTTNKTVLTKSAWNGAVKISAGMWRDTSAITQIQIGTGGNNAFLPGTTITLYGILAA